MKQLQPRQAETTAARDFEDTAIAATAAVHDLTVVTVNGWHLKGLRRRFHVCVHNKNDNIKSPAWPRYAEALLHIVLTP